MAQPVPGVGFLPKKNEYLGLIAPPGKKGLYLGYVNIPVGIGLYIGSKLAGYLYGNFGEKAMLKLQEVTGLDAGAATQLLWETYSPQVHVWVPFAVIGALSAVALWVFGRMARRWSDMDA